MRTFESLEPILTDQTQQGVRESPPVEIPDFTHLEPLTGTYNSLIYKGVHTDMGEVAVKVDCRSLLEVCQEATEKKYEDLSPQEALHVAGEQLSDTMAATVRDRSEGQQSLERHFGELVLHDQWQLGQVALPGSLLKHGLRSNITSITSVLRLHDDEVYEMKARIHAQTWSADLHDPKRLSLSARYAERSFQGEAFITPDDYKKATRALAMPDGPAVRTKSELTELLRIQGSPDLELLVEQLETNPPLVSSVDDFLDRTAAYMNSTQTVVDVISRDNVVFNPGCIMADVFTASNNQVLSASFRALEQLAVGESPTSTDANRFFNHVNIIRGLNIAAIACKSDVRFSVALPKGADPERLLDRILELDQEKQGLPKGELRIRV